MYDIGYRICMFVWMWMAVSTILLRSRCNRNMYNISGFKQITARRDGYDM